MKIEKNEIKSTAHSKYRCQYHIVFAPKYRRKEIYGKLKKDIGEILRKLCEQKGVEIIEAEACPDHIHMLVSIPPHLSIAQFMGYLKGKSSLMIFDRHANLKYKYGNTLCVSTQVGCRMGCAFCASAKIDFGRNLSAGELLAQVSVTQKELGERVHSLVIIGIG